NVAGILAHVTVVQDHASGGFVTLVPGSTTTRPGSSTVNPSTAVAFNGWATEVPTAGDGAGTFGIYSTNPSDVVVDVVGYWTGDPLAAGDGALSLIAPLRVVDTRGEAGGPIGLTTSGQ